MFSSPLAAAYPRKAPAGQRFIGSRTRRPLAPRVNQTRPKWRLTAKAVTATARKIATLFYNTLRHGIAYADPGASYYEHRYRARVLANLRRRAKSLGYLLNEMPAPT
jgi:hypothetical protein